MVVLIRSNDEPNSMSLNEYLVESEDDVAMLPTSSQKNAGETTCYPGSVAYTPDLEHIWVLGIDDTWHAI